MWHHPPLEEIFKKLATDPAVGLSLSDADERRATYGLNVLPEGKKKTWVYFLANQFKSPLVYILLIGAGLTFALKEWVDMWVILLSVAVNAAVGFWQEFRSSHIVEKLRALIVVSAIVVRGGKMQTLSAEQLVPGDILILKQGFKIPADARLIESAHLECDEAVLTGESNPVKKKTGELPDEKLPVGDRFNMVHMGTTIARGEGKAIVVATGAWTELGIIATLAENTDEDPTPLQVRIGKLGNTIAWLVGAVAILILAVGLIENHSFKEMFTTAIAVAVAAIPEGLPAAIAIVLAVSAQRILKQNGIVKRLVGAETLGSASVICTDKTGTLTEGKMVVEKILADSHERAKIILALANEALVEEKDGKTLVNGEVTDKAKMWVFLKEGGNIDMLLKTFPRISLLQFDPKLKYIPSLHKDGDKRALLVTGAAEILLPLCTTETGIAGASSLSTERRAAIEKEYQELAAHGYRVIAMTERILPEDGGNTDLEIEAHRAYWMRELAFVGLAAIRDPIRPDVKASIETARSAGIRVLMLTGDHHLTAKAIGADLGFSVADTAIITGDELDRLAPEELRDRLKTAEIFSRVDPSHKIKIVDMLQKSGEVVAMTGDGVNDAPALKSADIGVGVGSGTDVAKEASDLILLNDSFSGIVAAIKQGRIAFDNIRKVTIFLLAGSFTELMLVITALILRIPLPITAVQMLWTNLVEDSFPNVALSFEPGEKDIMERKPVAKKAPILDREGVAMIYGVGILYDILLAGFFIYFHYSGIFELEYLRTFVFAALGLDAVFYVYSLKSLTLPIWKYNIFDNPYLVAATFFGGGLMLAAIYLPFFNAALETVPLRWSEWQIVIALVAVKMLGIEAAKWWYFGRKKQTLNIGHPTDLFHIA